MCVLIWAKKIVQKRDTKSFPCAKIPKIANSLFVQNCDTAGLVANRLSRFDPAPLTEL